MRFKVEQVAMAIGNDVEKRAEAKKLLAILGFDNWIQDYATAEGKVRGEDATNVARLEFDYATPSGSLELELLEYIDGKAWTDLMLLPTISHLGMHVFEDELAAWKVKLADYPIVQEVDTISHSNLAIAGKRSYHYCIFGTRRIIGVDIKFIVRKDTAQPQPEAK